MFEIRIYNHYFDHSKWVDVYHADTWENASKFAIEFNKNCVMNEDGSYQAAAGPKIIRPLGRLVYPNLAPIEQAILDAVFELRLELSKPVEYTFSKPARTILGGVPL